LEVAGTRPAGPAVRWNWRHARLLGGLGLMVACAAAASLLAIPARALIDPESLREAVMAADDRSVIELWNMLSTSGVARPPTPEEMSLQRTFFLRRYLTAGLVAVGVIGVLAMLASGCAAALGRKRRR
jgi:hypothetical protein